MPTFVRTQTIEHEIGERGSLTLKITSGDVRLRGVDAPLASVRATFEIHAASEEEANGIFEESQLRVVRASGELSVEEPDERSSFGAQLGRLFGGRGHIDVNVEAELPRAAELRLDGVSADVQVEGLRGEQRYGSVSGDLYLTDLGGSIRLKTVSGDVTLRATLPVAVRADAVSGDLRVIAPRLDAFRATTVSGDLELEGELGRAGEFRVDTVSGDVAVGLVGAASFEVRGLSTDINSDLDHRIEGRLDRRRVVVGSGGPEFIFNSMSGDLAIRRPRRTGGPRPPAPPTPPAPPPPASPAPSAKEQMAILQALERGEISVEEAGRRLAGGASDE
jgi:DUF4097 and DUF4098 domain-containing protein YvlB